MPSGKSGSRISRTTQAQNEITTTGNGKTKVYNYSPSEGGPNNGLRQFLRQPHETVNRAPPGEPFCPTLRLPGSHNDGRSGHHNDVFDTDSYADTVGPWDSISQISVQPSMRRGPASTSSHTRNQDWAVTKIRGSGRYAHSGVPSSRDSDLTVRQLSSEHGASSSTREPPLELPPPPPPSSSTTTPRTIQKYLKSNAERSVKDPSLYEPSGFTEQPPSSHRSERERSRRVKALSPSEFTEQPPSSHRSERERPRRVRAPSPSESTEQPPSSHRSERERPRRVRAPSPSEFTEQPPSSSHRSEREHPRSVKTLSPYTPSEYPVAPLPTAPPRPQQPKRRQTSIMMSQHHQSSSTYNAHGSNHYMSSQSFQSYRNNH